MIEEDRVASAEGVVPSAHQGDQTHVIASVRRIAAEEARGAVPSTEHLTAMARFKEQMQGACVLVGSAWVLQGVVKARVRVINDTAAVEQGVLALSGQHTRRRGRSTCD